LAGVRRRADAGRRRDDRPQPRVVRAAGQCRARLDPGRERPESMNEQGLRRDRTHGWLGGVCAGIARHYGVDPGLIRLGFVVAIAAGGLGIAAYLLAWLVIPADGATGARRGMPRGRGALETGAGTALLLLSGLLTFRALGLPFSDVVVWPLVLIAGGAALIWRGSAAASPAPAPAGAPTPEPAPTPAEPEGE